jgi:hypothetical protein
VLEFFRTNNREDQVNDQRDGDEAYNLVFHVVVCCFVNLDFVTCPHEEEHEDEKACACEDV